MHFGNYEFKQTSSACPEQYDVFDEDGVQVAYVRLRWGALRVDYPYRGGTTIYYTGIGNDDGCFKNDSQRRFHLMRIAKRIDLVKDPTICPHCGAPHTMDSDYLDALEKCDMRDYYCVECDNYFMVQKVCDTLVVSEG